MRAVLRYTFRRRFRAGVAEPATGGRAGLIYAGVAELADALDSKSSDRKIMRVRLSPSALTCPLVAKNLVVLPSDRVLRHKAWRPPASRRAGIRHALWRRLPPLAFYFTSSTARSVDFRLSFGLMSSVLK